MSTSKIRGLLTAAGFLLAGMLGSQAANAAFETIPTIGLPKFVNDVKVRVTPNGKWTFTGKDGFTFIDSTNTYDGFNSRYQLKAQFDANNNLTSGSLTFKGIIPDIGITDTTTVLLSASLTDYDFAGNVMAFKTSIDIGGSAICSLYLCSAAESIWLVLDDALPGQLKGNNFRTAGFAITTIPVPAAVWLFGSGLGLLGGTAIRRRKKEKSVA